MKEFLPDKTSNIIPFSLATQECLDNTSSEEHYEHPSITHVSDSGKFVYIAKGASLELVNVSSGSRLSACNFNSNTTQRVVTCICKYENNLIIGMKCHSPTSTGAICVYNPGVSRITKAISIPTTPTSVCIVKEGGGVYGETSFVSESLKSFFGVIAVGTTDGHLYLIDLRADDIEELFSLSCPSTILPIDPAEMGCITKQRDMARLRNMHCAVDLSASMCSFRAFKYVSPTGKILKVCATGNCVVSALVFVKQTVELIVGFSFGCFQIWSLEHMQLLYSSEVNLNMTPVTSFIIQEPDDDPRHCCYLWVGKSPFQTQENIASPTSIELYQMLYERKDNEKDYGPLYKNLECVMVRFEHRLTSDVHHLADSRTLGSRIISFKCLEDDLSVCYVLWEAPTSDGRLSCHLGLFDLNRWYQKQLPSSIRHAMFGRMEPVCPFFIFYSMTDISEKFLPVGLVDIHLDAGSRNNFRSIAGVQSEQFYWPSSSSFQVVCISETGCIWAQILGTQRQIIADMHKMGIDSFLGAQELIESCWVTGLLNNTHDITRVDNEKKTAHVRSVRFN